MSLSSQRRTPVETLEEQLRALEQIVRNQQEQLAKLTSQDDKISALLDIANGLQGRAGCFRVRIESIDMPFMEMVNLLVKVSLAAIPAALIVVIVCATVIVLFVGLLGGLSGILVGLIGP